MNLKNCPQQYRRIILKFLSGFSSNTVFLEKDAYEYIEDLSKNEKLSQENHRLYCSALKWFYKHILGIHLKLKVPYRKRPLPDTLTLDEVQDILKELPARYLLLFQFMYGLGMKIGEVLKLRIKDVDINNGRLFLSKGREFKIPMYLFESVKKHFQQRQKRYIRDKKEGNCYIPNDKRGFSTDFMEQPFFASRKRTRLKGFNLRGRQFIDPSTLHVYLSMAQKKVKFFKRTTCMTFRHSFALYQLENNCNEVVLKEYLGHSDIRQTLHYKKLIKRAFFTPYEMLTDNLSTEQMKELNILQRFPSEEELIKFLSKAAKKTEGKIRTTGKKEQWLNWQRKAQRSNLNFSEKTNDKKGSVYDYTFLDLTTLADSRPLRKIRTIQALLSQSRKKLLIYSDKIEQGHNTA